MSGDISGRLRIVGALLAERAPDGRWATVPGVVDVEDGRVVRVLEAPEQTPSLGADVLDLTGMTLVPGLVDRHVHLTWSGGSAPWTDVCDEDILTTQVERLLRGGFVQLRDLGSFALRADVLREVAGERIEFSSPPLTEPSGHCWWLGGEIRDVTDARRVLGESLERGATWAKIMINGGFVTPGSSAHRMQFDSSMVAQLTRLAHERGLRVAAHAHTRDAIAAAVDAGVDSIEHATFLTSDGRIEVDEVLVKEIAARGMEVCPTVTTNIFSGPNFEFRRNAIKTMARHGVALSAGSDAGIPGCLPEHPLAALAPWAAVLGSVGAALDICTVGSPDGSRGVSALTGGTADLLVLGGDVTRDLAAIADLRGVLIGGRLHERVSA